MTEITSISGLFGKLEALRDWDFPTHTETFWPAFEKQVANALGTKKRLRASKHVHAMGPTGIVYEVALLSKARDSGQNVEARCWVTTTNA